MNPNSKQWYANSQVGKNDRNNGKKNPKLDKQLQKESFPRNTLP